MSRNNLLGIYEKAMPADLSFQERFEIAKTLGFDFFEISIDESQERQARLEWTEEEIIQIKRLCEQYNMPIQSMCLSAHRQFPYGSDNSETRKQAHVIMEKAILLAHKLGVRVIQLAGYDVYYEEHSELTHQRFVNGMKSASKLAEQYGVMLGIEIMDTEYLNSLSKFEILKREVSSPYLMVYPDIGNVSAWNYDVCTELMLSQHHIVQIHLKDTLAVKPGFLGQFRDLVIGEGEVDFKKIFNTLDKMEYTAPFVIEMWAKDERWQQNIEYAFNYIKTMRG